MDGDTQYRGALPPLGVIFRNYFPCAPAVAALLIPDC